MNIKILLYMKFARSFHTHEQLVWSTSWITFVISMEMTEKQRLGKVFKLPKAKLTISDRIKCKPISFDLCFSSLYYAIQIQVNRNSFKHFTSICSMPSLCQALC